MTTTIIIYTFCKPKKQQFLFTNYLKFSNSIALMIAHDFKRLFNTILVKIVKKWIVARWRRCNGQIPALFATFFLTKYDFDNCITGFIVAFIFVSLFTK